MKQGFVYLMASGRLGTRYLGVTSDLIAGVYQHRNALVDGFTKRYGCTRPVWFEAYDDLQQARLRELRMKKWKRDWKIELIDRTNPDWNDLWPSIARG